MASESPPRRELNEPLSRSDTVSLHLPLSIERRDFIGREQLAECRQRRKRSQLSDTLLRYRHMLFSAYASRSCTRMGLLVASHCISVGGPLDIKKLVVQTCTPSSTNTSSTDRSTNT